MSLYNIVAKELKSWIDEHAMDKLNVQIAADKAGYSRYHLQRVFSAEFGKSLGVYMRELRLKCAAHDLLMTDDNIITVADRYNFDSQQSFTRSFSKMYHMPPSKWRHKNKKQTPQ